MDNFLDKCIDKLWLRPISLPILYIIALLGALGQLPDPPNPITLKHYCIWALFFIVTITYTIEVIRHNTLPKAKDALSSVLFIIDTESEQFYKDVEKKLISEFEYYTTDGSGKKYSAICIDQQRLKNFDFWNKDTMTKLLYKVNCMLVVLVKHRVDSVTDAENFMMHINYAILHPTLEQNLHELLKLDMQNLSAPLRTRKFCKSETINEMMYTAASLSIICQYLIGLVLLLSGRLHDAYGHFSTLRNHIINTKPNCLVSGFNEVLDNRLLVTCKALKNEDLDDFYLNKNETALEKINSRLEEINSITPNTYEYYLEKAFFHVARNSNIAAARDCVKVCKQFKNQNSWRYSDAFLTAYENRPPLMIYRKYSTAFKYDQDLSRIVDYIEYILDKEPDRIGLHLAAGLVYHEIDQKQLSTEHLNLYLKECSNDSFSKILIDKGVWDAVTVA